MIIVKDWSLYVTVFVIQATRQLGTSRKGSKDENLMMLALFSLLPFIYESLQRGKVTRENSYTIDL